MNHFQSIRIIRDLIGREMIRKFPHQDPEHLELYRKDLIQAEKELNELVGTENIQKG